MYGSIPLIHCHFSLGVISVSMAELQHIFVHHKVLQNLRKRAIYLFFSKHFKTLVSKQSEDCTTPIFTFKTESLLVCVQANYSFSPT